MPVSVRTCRCGCGGEVTPGINRRTRRPFEFVLGHNQRGAGLAPAWTVNPQTGCWEWEANVNPVSGYGRLRVDGALVLAHRWSYERFVGPIPDGLELDHLCRNRRCVNPEHLEAVTHTENVRRGAIACRLTREDVVALRARYATEGGSAWALAKRIGAERGLSRFTVYDAIVGRTWQGIEHDGKDSE